MDFSRIWCNILACEGKNSKQKQDYHLNMRQSIIMLYQIEQAISWLRVILKRLQRFRIYRGRARLTIWLEVLLMFMLFCLTSESDECSKEIYRHKSSYDELQITKKNPEQIRVLPCSKMLKCSLEEVDRLAICVKEFLLADNNINYAAKLCSFLLNLLIINLLTINLEDNL